MSDQEPQSSARGGKRKRKSKAAPTSKARSEKQRTKDRYAHAREDAQLQGLIPTIPAEALKPEVVSPASQEDAPHPELIAEAIRRGWAVPEEKKPVLVDELLAIVNSSVSSDKVKVAAFNALRMADREQYERDHPAVSPGANLPGANTTNITNIHGDVVNNKLTVAATIREMIERGELGVIEDDGGDNRRVEEPEPPDITSASSSK